VVDASGRAAFLARKLGHFRQNTEHPINAVWARFTGLKDWDSYEWRERFPDYAAASRTGRAWATNHLMGQGWWCWIIPLKGGDFSAGLVYDNRLFTLPAGASLGERLYDHILMHPVGREIFRDAKIVEHDTRAYSALPYHSAQVCGGGWAIAGDEAIKRGAKILRGTAIKALQGEDGALVGIRIRHPNGEEEDISTKVVLDCSGQSTFLANQKVTGPKYMGSYDKQVAFFIHVRGAIRGSGTSGEAKTIRSSFTIKISLGLVHPDRQGSGQQEW
jgi:flavin-dependent dehydrogenase